MQRFHRQSPKKRKNKKRKKKKQIVFGKKYLEPNMVSHLTYDFWRTLITYPTN